MSSDVRRQDAGIKSGGEVSDEQQATENKDEAWVEVPPDTQAEQDSADDYNHQESHKSTEQGGEYQPRGRFRDLDEHASWQEVYRACGVDGYGHE